MSNASHRNPREHGIHIPAIPWGYLVTGAVLFMLAVALLVAVSLLGKPTYAGASTTGYLKPAITTAKVIKPRPFWDGRSPAVYIGDDEPMCAPRYAGRLGIAEDAPTGVWFALKCEAEGDSGPWSWAVLGTNNGQSLSWSQVGAYCRQAGCKRPSLAILDMLGYGTSPAWMHAGDTSAIFVKTAHGVRVYSS